MIFTFDKYGNLIDSDTDDILIQQSTNANTLYASFEGIDLKEYLPYISFERSDNQISPRIAMSYSGNNISYRFSEPWITEKAGILKCTITLFQDNIVKRTASFNLNVVKAVKLTAPTNVNEAVLRELEARTFTLEQSVFELIENGASNVRLVEIQDKNQIYIAPKNYTDYTFSSENLISVEATLMDNVGQGFITGINFKADADGVTFKINNETNYDLYIWKNGLQTTTIPDIFKNSLFQLVIICDGLAIHCYYRLTEIK